MDVGKPPHRPEGKTRDAEHMTGRREAPSQKEVAERDRRRKEARGGPGRIPAEEELRGSRPGVPSRVKEAVDEREARE